MKHFEYFTKEMGKIGIEAESFFDGVNKVYEMMYASSPLGKRMDFKIKMKQSIRQMLREVEPDDEATKELPVQP